MFLIGSGFIGKNKKCKNCSPTLLDTAFPSLFWILCENAAEKSWGEDEIFKFQIQEGIMSSLKELDTYFFYCVKRWPIGS